MTQPQVEVFPFQVVLIRNFLSVEVQKDTYINELFNPSKGSNEHLGLTGKLPKLVFYPALNALPLGVYKNIFSGISNITEPVKLLAIGNQAVEIARNALAPTNSSASVDLQFPEKITINNCYSQLYPAGGKAISHIDLTLGWVVSISVGDACEFQWGPDKRTVAHSARLNSGDVIIFNGGKVYHSVKTIYANTAPDFWRSGEIETYGHARLNIQMRDLSSLTADVSDEWKNLYKY